MDNLTTAFLAGEVLTSGYTAWWLFFYPCELWETLVFAHGRTFIDITAGLVCWVFLLWSVGLLAYVVLNFSILFTAFS